MAPPPLLPTELARERGTVLHRALRHLPRELLEPLLRGLRRHADALAPNRLYVEDGSGGCAVGVMLLELASERPARTRRGWFRRAARSIRDERPDLARAHPRVAHIELVFDKTCAALGRRDPWLCEREVARRVGLWMAAEVQAEINLRHVEALAIEADPEGSVPQPRASRRGATAEEALFAGTVARLRDLRPWLSEPEAVRVLEGWLGVRRLEPHPTFVPAEWVEEVQLQRSRLADVVPVAR